MTTPLVKSLIDEQVSSLEQAFRLPRETLVKHLPKPIKGHWRNSRDLRDSLVMR